VEFEEGHFTSSNIGDPSSLMLLRMPPVILSEAKDLLILGRGKDPFPTNPKRQKLILGGVGGGDFSLLH